MGDEGGRQIKQEAAQAQGRAQASDAGEQRSGSFLGPEPIPRALRFLQGRESLNDYVRVGLGKLFCGDAPTVRKIVEAHKAGAALAARVNFTPAMLSMSRLILQDPAFDWGPHADAQATGGGSPLDFMASAIVVEVQRQRVEIVKQLRDQRRIIEEQLARQYARQHDMNYTPDSEIKPPSFWRELAAGADHQIVGGVKNLGIGILTMLTENARRSSEMQHDANERGIPVSPTGASMSVFLSQTFEGISTEVNLTRDALERAMEAQGALNKSIEALDATIHLVTAGMGAYGVVEPIAAVTLGGGSAGGGLAMAGPGDGAAVAAARGVAIDGTRGGAASLPRLTAGLGQDVGENPAAEDKTMHDGDRADQQKRERKDKRDAQHERKPSKDGEPLSEMAKHIPPSGRAFTEWFDALTVDLFEQFWADESARKIIARNIREPGGLHEWLQVAEARRFKEWNVSMEVIQDARTLTSETFGRNFKHGDAGSGSFHRTTRAMIQSAPDFESFVARLNDWADQNLVNGRHSLPATLVR